jgi:hypothetical protein
MDILIMKDQSLPLTKEMAKLLAPPRLFLLVNYIVRHYKTHPIRGRRIDNTKRDFRLDKAPCLY